MATGRCCSVLLVVATSAVVLSAAACKSFSADDPGTTGPADAGADVAVGIDAETGVGADTGAARDANGCPTEVVFEDMFDGAGPDPAVWRATKSGSGVVSGTMPGQFVASVTKAFGDVATIDKRFTLPHPSQLVCITLRARILANPMDFSGGYVATMETDLRANKNDVGHAFLALGIDKSGVFTNVMDDQGVAQTGRPVMSTTSSAPLSTVIYRIESNGTTSVVTILVDGKKADQRPLTKLGQVADIDLALGATGSDVAGGAFGPVTFTLASVVVTAE